MSGDHVRSSARTAVKCVGGDGSHRERLPSLIRG
jgi:hypothetical protein